MPRSTITPDTLGIDLSSKKEADVFKWFLACLLFGKPIRQEIAAQAYHNLIRHGIASIKKLAGSDWNDIVDLLDAAHYVRYDFSTATKLLYIAKEIQVSDGTITELIHSSRDAQRLRQRLLSMRGIGPVTARIFLHEVAPIFYKDDVSHEFEVAVSTAQVISSHGFEAFIVGGAVRDLLLGKEPKDIDLVTNARPEQIIALPQFKKAIYKDPAQAYGVTRVIITRNDHKHELEIATFRKDIEPHKGRKGTRVEYATLEDDLLRRDISINALALDIETNFVIDYAGGIDDLESRTIRFIGDPYERIREDPLRIMRAIRFKNHLEFQYDHETAEAIMRAVKSGYIEQIATDRLRDELSLLLVHPKRRQTIIELDQFGILDRILPEVTAGKKVKQPPQYHAEGNVWNHELLIMDYLPSHPSRRLAWASLLHDIGKGPTAHHPAGSDRIRFDRHYAVGAEMAKTIMRRLNFSKHDTEDIVWMIYNHMAIDDLPSMRPSSRQKMLGHPAFEDLLELHRADAAASWRPGKPQGHKPHFRAIEKLWHDYRSLSPEKQQPSLKNDLGIDGSWLIKHFSQDFNLSEGPIVGKILAELEEFYRDEGQRDQKVYLKKARQILISQSSKP